MLFKLCLVAAIVALCSSSCNLPTRFWCDTKAIAQECGVEASCAEQRWVDRRVVKPVQVNLFMESYCGSCMHFLINQLYPAWQALGKTGIMNVTVYSYGNADEVYDPNTGTWNITCQHGSEECQMNLVENCVQKYTNRDVSKYLPVMVCMEQSIRDKKKSEKQCVEDAGLDWNTINKCATGPEGNKLMHEAGVVTERQEPPIFGVPWITLEGMHSAPMELESLIGNFTQLVCDTFQGIKPPQCHPPPTLEVTKCLRN